MNNTRCPWLDESPLYRDYHDHEWGRPVHQEQKLFEMLSLEAFQAGLSWITILKKREAFRKAFDNFDPQVVAGYDEDKIEQLVQDAGIVRHRGKIVAVIHNAALFLDIQKSHGSFDAFIWGYVDGVPLQPSRRGVEDVPAKTPLSDTISKNLKKRGFRFLGSTTVYAFMQAIGMVNDHVEECFCHRLLGGEVKDAD